MMIVDLAEIEGSARQFEIAIEPAEIDLDTAIFRLADKVNVSGAVLKRSAQIDVEGSIEADAEIDCTRCLKPMSRKLNIDFAVSFVTPDNFGGDSKDHEVLAADLDIDVLEADRIDLKEIVREQIMLNLPAQALCLEDCKGLCPKCGTDLNLIDCNCELDETDPRWAALKDFRS